MILIRSLLFQTYFYVSVSLFAVGIIACFFLPFRTRFFFAHWWGRSMLAVGKWICGFRYSIEGVENVLHEPCVIMCKHTSVFETYMQLAVFPPQTWVVKRELLWIPFFGWGLAAMSPIAIDRNAGRSAVTQVIEQGKALLAAGVSVMIYPEGTRVPPGATRKYGISGAALAREAGVRITPVAHNAGDLWPRRGLLKKPGLIRVVIGPPIDATTQTPRETNSIVQHWVESRMAEISSAYSDTSDSTNDNS